MSEIIPAILVISKVTYGAVIGKKNCYYYKCYYGDKTLLVPHKVDYKKFNKNFTNKYVLVKYINNFGVSGPRGQIIETLGPVTDTDAYKRWLLATILYKWQMMPLTIPMSSIPVINVSENTKIFTIDPKGSTDLDDAFSISKNNGTVTLTIMIANVPMACGTDTKVSAVSTIYTDDKVVHMLGKNVVHYSLLADGIERHVLCLDVVIRLNGSNEPVVINHVLYNKKVSITENFNYETVNETVNDLISLTNCLNTVYKRFVKENIIDSHKAIEYTMIYFSAYCAQVLKDNKTGIFRTLEIPDNTDKADKADKADKTLSQFLEHWEKSAMYTKEPVVNKQFGTLYAHITSPIRRFVDCVNMFMINSIINNGDFMIITDELVSLLNEQNKFIKKIQTSINMLNVLKDNPDTVYNAYVIDKTSKTEKAEKIMYTIYIPEISLVTEYKCHETIDTHLQLYERCHFKLYLFENKNNFKQKVKLMLVND